MNEREDREELLNSFVDGELSEQQRVEVERLATQDSHVSVRIAELRRLRALVSGLPRLEAPACVSEHVKAELERLAVHGAARRVTAEALPRRSLVLPARLLAVAAAVLLVFGLTFFFSQSRDRSEPLGPVAGAPSGSEVPSRSTSTRRGLLARLEVECSALPTVDGALNRALRNNGLSTLTDSREEGQSRSYRIRASRQAVAAFLEDVAPAWPKFEAASLRLTGADFGVPLILDTISASQMRRIFQQEDAERSVGLARQFAVQNSMEDLRLSERLMALSHGEMDKSTALAIPVLTGPGPTPPAAAPAADDGRVTELTIVLRPSRD